MKYILSICNLVGALFMGYIFFTSFKHTYALREDYATFVNKYKTENAAEAAYISDVYHLGDWATVLTDTLALQYDLGLSEASRVHAINCVSLAISYEETSCSYLVAFENTITTIVKPYILAETSEKTLLANVTFDGGTLIDKSNNSTININNIDELVSQYRIINNVHPAVTNDNVLKAMHYDFIAYLNKTIDEALGTSVDGQKNSAYLSTNLKDKAGGKFSGNGIDNQSLIVINSTDQLNATTTLAGYGKTQKRQICTITGPRGKFYCYSDEIPAGYTISNLYDNTYLAQKEIGVLGRLYVNK